MTLSSAPPPLGAPAAALAFLNKPTVRSGALKWALIGFLVVGLLLAGLLFLALAGFELGIAGLLVAMAAAMLPVPVYIMLVLWIDRLEPEPAWLLACAFVWGSTVAILFSYVFNSTMGWILGSVTGSPVVAAVGVPVFSAPFAEEFSKGLFILLLFVFMSDEFDGVIDGIVYASLIGLGFAMAENTLYLGRQFTEHGIGGMVGLFGLRNVLTPFAHPLFTSMTGIGLGYAVSARGPLLKFAAGILGFIGAMSLHGLWNLMATLGFFWLGYILVFIPIFILLLATAAYSLHREQLIVRRFLKPELDSGLLTLDQYEVAASIIRRTAWSFHVLTHRGFRGWLAAKHFQRAAAELAFERHRLDCGAERRREASAVREARYLAELRDLRPLITFTA